MTEAFLMLDFSIWVFYKSSLSNDNDILISFFIKSIPILVFANCVNNLLILNFLQLPKSFSLKRKLLSYSLWFYTFVIVLLLFFVFLEILKDREVDENNWDFLAVMELTSKVLFILINIYILIEQFSLMKQIKVNRTQLEKAAIDEIGRI